MSEKLTVDNLSFEVRRSPRWKTLGLTVDRGGELIIHAPESGDATDLARWTRSRLVWVHQKLLTKSIVAPRRREPEFVSGESFSYLGRSYRLKVIHVSYEALSFDGTGDTFVLMKMPVPTRQIILGLGMFATGENGFAAVWHW